MTKIEFNSTLAENLTKTHILFTVEAILFVYFVNRWDRHTCMIALQWLYTTGCLCKQRFQIKLPSKTVCYLWFAIDFHFKLILIAIYVKWGGMEK